MFYKIGYHSYEDSHHFIFSSSTKYTKGELHELVKKEIKELINDKNDFHSVSDLVSEPKLAAAMAKYDLTLLFFEENLSYWGWNHREYNWNEDLEDNPDSEGYYKPLSLESWEMENTDIDKDLILFINEALEEKEKK